MLTFKNTTDDNKVNTNNNAIHPLNPSGLVDVGHVWTVLADLFEGAKVTQTQCPPAFADDRCHNRTWHSLCICYEIPTIPPYEILQN